MNKKIFVYIGSYGSGKTELSLNVAIRHARQGKKTALVDLDVVNPFFRSGFHKELLESYGVDLISSSYFLEAADVPVVTARVNAAFDGDFDVVVFDVGGDPVGATALGQYKDRFDRLDPERLSVCCVVNTLRPLTNNVSDICEMIEKLELSSRLKIDYLINNTNLSNESNESILFDGETMLEEVSRKTSIPLLYDVACGKYVTKQTSLHNRPIEHIKLYTHLNWLDFDPAFKK